ncbi:hypothetical protein ACE1ET_16495 [Saccharicrinis sp. FJH62]|uniref:hypothetical protein n=1 Tax=Saccharicrinis sp. FJH62 TaxID=3344657 RepID=UPI0035D4658E
MKFYRLLYLFVFLGFLSCTSKKNNEPTNDYGNLKIRGWNILSSEIEKGKVALNSAEYYNINHLQLSHELIMDLKDVRKKKKLKATCKLIKKAHRSGIQSVLVWDHAIYNLDYYPDKFKNKEGLINLDDPEFWKWFKNDYRSMLDCIPDLNGIVLTFIETGARIENQYSTKWTTDSEKLANLVDSIASVVIDERNMQLYIRTFMYYKEELNALIDCVNLIRNPKVKIMTKEVPHDFFLTHPVSTFIKKFDKEVIIEFDLGHEYNGQGVIASILPEVTINRWKYYAKQKNVIGYIARTDRYDKSQNIGRPTEINIYALKRISEDTSLSAEVITEEFITQKYGEKLVPYLKDVFLETDDIITSIFYTLGLHTNSHSRLDFDYQSNYSRHCSGKWLDNPTVKVEHNVNKKFHYWKDIIEHLSPARYKSKEISPGIQSILFREAPWVIDSNWVSPSEKMNKEYLNYIIREKEFGVEKAKWAVNKILSAKPYFTSKSDYKELISLYERTLLTAKLYYYSSKAYFGFRCYLNEGECKELNLIIKDGLSGIKSTCEEMNKYPNKGHHGQFYWIKDIDRANKLYKNITEGWGTYDNKKFDL